MAKISKNKSTKKVKNSYTNTSGQKVTNYSDGSKTKTGAITNTAKIGDTVNGQKVRSLVGGKAYASSKDAPGYYDTFEGKGEMSAGKPIMPIPTDLLTSQQNKMGLPNTPNPTSVPSLTSTNAGLAPLLSNLGITMDANGSFSNAKPTQDGGQSDIFSQYMQAYGNIEQPNLENIYAKEERNAKLRQKEQEVNNLTGQINSIVAQSQAESLALEGQGRGITESIIGGQQAQIAREAAIQALPVQAQLAAAQGALEVAQKHVDTMFQIKAQDAQAQYQFKTKVLDSVFQFANQQEQRRLDDIRRKEDRAYDMQKTSMALANDWAKTALEYGQSGVAGGIMSIDWTQPDAQTKFQSYTSQIRKPVAVAKRDTQFNANGDLVDMQTGEIITQAGGVSQPDQVQKSLDQISFLQTTINDAKNLVDATGPNLLSQGLGKVFIGNTRAKQLATKLDTLKTNLLTLNSDPALKKFFGPQMTEKDTQLLMSAGSTLDAYNASESDNRAELKRYEDLLNRMQKAINQGDGNTWGVVITGGDGLQYIIQD